MVTTLWMCFLPLLTLVVVTKRNQVKMKVRRNQITQPHITHFSFPPFPPFQDSHPVDLSNLKHVFRTLPIKHTPLFHVTPIAPVLPWWTEGAGACFLLCVPALRDTIRYQSECMYARMRIPCLYHPIDVGPNAITDKERGVKMRGERTGLSQPASSQIPYRAASRRF